MNTLTRPAGVWLYCAAAGLFGLAAAAAAVSFSAQYRLVFAARGVAVAAALEAAIPDAAAWFTRHPLWNLAVATGAPGPDVLDVDQHGPAGNGYAAFARLQAAGLLDVPGSVQRLPGFLLLRILPSPSPNAGSLGVLQAFWAGLLRSHSRKKPGLGPKQE